MSTNKYEEIIKEYLERECEKDSALKAAYKADAIHKCFAFITSQAKKIAVNNCAMVEDVKVYKWARDYYFDILPNEKEKKAAPENDEPEEYDEEEIIEAAKEPKKNGKKKQPEPEKEEIEFVGSLF